MNSKAVLIAGPTASGKSALAIELARAADGVVINTDSMAVLLLVLGLSSSVAWTLFGASLQSLVRSPVAVRVFNWVMAGLLLASLYPVLTEG